MPAYRSSAEADIREAVVARIRENRPGARIIHEINVSTYGPNRIDLIAVSPAEVIAVEIKSAKDKLDRLPAQVEAMKGCAHHVIAAIHEKFLVEHTTHAKAMHYERDGTYYTRGLPDGISHSIDTWVFPEKRRCVDPNWSHDGLERWRMPRQGLERSLPAAAINLLWRDELAQLCYSLRISTGRKSTMPDMIAALRWHCTGKELTLGICRLLRSRECCEADAPILEAAA